MSEAPPKGDPKSARRARIFAAIVLVPTLLAVLAATLGPIASGDIFWHLRTGEWILAHGALPTIDPFSHTAGDTHWVLQEYGSQILFALAYKLAGFTGLKLLGALLSLAILVAIYRRARRDLCARWAAVLTATFALLFALKWELRPQLMSLLFFFWLERCLFPSNRSLTAYRFLTPPPRRWLELGLLSALWVQMHAEALFAPLVTFAVFTGAWIASLREGAGWRHATAWLAMAALALAGTLASPLLTEPHIYALIGREVPQQYIEEWFRPWVLPGDARFAPLTFGIFGTYVAALLAGGTFTLKMLIARLSSPREGAARSTSPSELTDTSFVHSINFERIAFLAACLLFALSARRFLWLTWFPLLDMLAWSLRSRPWLRLTRMLPLLISLWLGMLLVFTHYPQAAWHAFTRGRAASIVDPALFPSFAADFIRETGIEGRLFHPYEWGGYLGMLTKQPVFIDGRTVLFEDVIEERWIAERDLVQRTKIFKERGVEVIVFDHFVQTTSGLRPWKPGGDQWLLVWSDNWAVVWVKRGSENNLRATRWWRSQGVSLDPLDGITAADVNLGQPNWIKERSILPTKVVQMIRDVELRPGDTSLKSVLDRSKLWRSMGMKRNQRAELRHAAELGEKLEGLGRAGIDERAKELRGLLKKNDLDGFIRFMELSPKSGLGD